ncbi:PPOX class F420-dependent oxidoreductase [Streptosporangium sp. NBC_01756]|uniref:PPOX class F420-dependent oxidoreductase n=1 Tax=Streptosporangium sp. NBC_01756 TaxID=2975950 RepID=UPI002DDA3E97|nr:PPOX class F420-dependent oxidoreductase [Streptosporangium sp. NBC_01756]WSC84406.1 PPOX class F420-dependent oxidoreductase [Streptosporangium sp. NBC_01756]
MSIFTNLELAYLHGERLLGRLATVGPDGMPHVAPVGWSLDGAGLVIEISGRNFGRSKKFRDVARTGRAALVVDDVLPPWRPRGVEVRGRAEAVPGAQARILLYPTRIVSWGLESGQTIEDTYRARDVEGTVDA